MAEYIDVTELKRQISDFKRKLQSPNSDYLTGYICALSVTEGMIAGIPTADVVSSAVLEQVRWERDMALETLKEHGIGFCEKSDVVEVRHGEWKLYGNDDDIGASYFCSLCGWNIDEGEYLDNWSHFKYCPNCGARMDGDDSE